MTSFSPTPPRAAQALLRAVLPTTAPLDPLAFLATSLGLLGVVMLSSYLPARKASTVDPIEALRME